MSATPKSVLPFLFLCWGFLNFSKDVVYYVINNLFLDLPMPSFIRNPISVLLVASCRVSPRHIFLLFLLKLKLRHVQTLWPTSNSCL